MNLVIEGITAIGSGSLQLQRELALSAAETAPSGANVVLLQTELSERFAGPPNLKIHRFADPGRSWAKLWNWLNMELPYLVATFKPDAFFPVHGQLSRRALKTFACIGSVNNME